MTGHSATRRTTRSRPVFYGWWMVAGLCITELLSWGVLVHAFAVFVVPMHAELGWSPAQLNGAYTTGVIVSGLVAVPVGRWLQHRGARGVMTSGSLLGVAALLVWAQTESLPGFYAAFVLAGLAMATTLYEPAFAVTATWFHHHRARAVLVLTIAGGLSSTVFVPLSGALIGAYGWRTTLVLLAGALAVITVPIHVGLLRRWPSDLGLHRDGHIPSNTGNPEPPASARQPNSAHPAITRRASFRWITVTMFSHTAAKMAVTVILVAYLTNRGYAMPQATLAAGGIGAFQVLGRLITTGLRPWVPEHRIAAVVFGIQALALPVPLFTTGHGPVATATVATLVVCFGLGYGLPDLLRGTLLADYYGPDHYAHVNGVLSTFVVAARAVGPLVAGLVVTMFHTHTATLIGAALLTLTSAYALHRAHRAHSTDEASTPSTTATRLSE